VSRPIVQDLSGQSHATSAVVQAPSRQPPPGLQRCRHVTSRENLHTRHKFLDSPRREV